MPPANPPPRPRRNGFTLVELMVVIVILGLLATVVVINVLPAQEQGKIGKARTDIATLEQALEQYAIDIGRLPSGEEGLDALTSPPRSLRQPEKYRAGGYIRRLPQDPWGNPYRYARPGEQGRQYDVYSTGADGAPGGEGDGADIGNWN